MISFIIIGRNEGWKLTNCLKSVYKTIDINRLNDCEIIYIDSASTDNSIVRAKEFTNIRIFELIKDFNPAIARNLGAIKSRGEILYFIDGDMEIEPEFLSLTLKNNRTLIHPFLSGQYVNYFYSIDNELINKENYDKSIQAKDDYKTVTGGLFIIKKDLWDQVSGMRNKYRFGEDIDFGLRLARSGLKLLRKKEVMAIHNTIDYRDSNRMWKMIANRSELYGRSMLYRDHIFNKHIYPIIFRNDYSMLILSLVFIFSVILSNALFLMIYLVVVFFRSLKLSANNLSRLFSYIGYYMTRDFLVLIGILVFFPRKKFNITYNEL